MLVQLDKEPALDTKRSDSRNTFEQLGETGENGRSSIALHPSEVTAGIKISDSQL